MGDHLRLGLVQMTSTDDIDQNLNQVTSLYLEALSLGAELVVFPENSLFMRLRSGSPMKGVEIGGAELTALNQLVERSGPPLLLTTPIKTSDRYRNSTLLFEKGSLVREVYSKIHLFDVDVNGAPPVRESEHFSHGSEPAKIQIGDWKIGLTICYDLRFSELYLRYAQTVDLILVPAAFLVPTGEAHWHVLLRARAIETQAFVAAPAQSGEHVSTTGAHRKTYGHSLVVDPWGRVLTEILGSPEVRVVDLNRAEIERARSQIPMAHHRRL